MGISLGAHRFLQNQHRHTHMYTPTIPRVLIIRLEIKSLRFYMLKASKCGSSLYFQRSCWCTVLPLYAGIRLAEGPFITQLETS